MVIEIDPACCNGSRDKKCKERENDFLREVERLMAIWAFGAIVLSRGMMSQEEEERKRSSKVGEELSVGGGHAVPFTVHLYTYQNSH